MKSIFSFFTLSFLFLLTSCGTDELRDIGNVTVNHEGDYAITIGSIVFTMADLIENDSNLTSDGSDGLKIVYKEDNFFTLTADELLDDLTGDISETFTESKQVGEIELEDLIEDSGVPFENVLSNFMDATLVSFFENANGTNAMVPSFNENPNFEQAVPTFPNYTSVTFSNGTLKLSITNSLFFDVEDLEVEIYDEGNGQTLGTMNFNSIAVGETIANELDLSGKTVSNEFKVIWKKINSPGTANQVLVDLSKQLLVFLKMEGLSVNAGTAELPEGVLVEGESMLDFTLDNEEQIRKMKMNSVEVSYEIISDIATDMSIQLEFPAVLKGGVPVVQTFNVSPSNTMGTLDFDNTEWLLDQNTDQPFNRMMVNYEAGIPMGGSGQVTFNATDEIEIKLTVKNLEVEEVIGYFGNFQESFSSSTRDFGFDFSFLTDESSPLYFEDPVIRISIDNSFGIPMESEMNATASGLTGGNAALSPPKIVINSPDINEIGQSSHTLAIFNKLNSNLVELLSILPLEIMYEGGATINPAADPSANNFIHSDSRLEADLEFCLPFKFSAENLVYRDTGDAPDLGLDDGNFTIDDIENAIMKVSYDNGIPMVSQVNLIALDAAGNETTVIENVKFTAATTGDNEIVDPDEIANGSELVELDRSQIQSLNDADFYIYELILQTEGSGQTPVTLYLDYFVDMGFGLTFTVKPK